MVQHKSVTAEMAQTAFVQLLLWAPPVELSGLYIEVVRLATSHSGFIFGKSNFYKGKTANEFCMIEVNNNKREKAPVLNILNLLSNCSTENLNSVFKELVNMYKLDLSLSELITKVLITIVSHADFNANEKISKGQENAAHLCAQKQVIPVLKVISNLDSFHPDSINSEGKIFLYYLCQRVTFTDTITFLDGSVSTKINANTAINNDNQTAAFYYAKHNNTAALQDVCKLRSFDPNVQDTRGQTVLFPICKYLPVAETLELLGDTTLAWNFSLIDKEGRSVRAYYESFLKCNTHLTLVLDEATRKNLWNGG